MVWQVLLLETFKSAFACLLICCNTTVHFLPVCCLAIGYIQWKIVSLLKKMYSIYSLWMFLHSLSLASEALLRTRKGWMQLITSHDKKDHDGKTNIRRSAARLPNPTISKTKLLEAAKVWLCVRNLAFQSCRPRYSSPRMAAASPLCEQVLQGTEHWLPYIWASLEGT